MGLLDTILSTIDAKKRSAKRGIMDMLDNPQQWAGMQANRIQEDRYGGAENAQAMKQYLSKQPYDQKALTAANDALRNAAINESLGAVTAWHGSPHKFDKFDMSKIGTGEGAQAYGHGLYLAESPKVAGGYRDKLAKNEVLLDGKKVKHDFNATDPQSLGLNALTSEPSAEGAAKALRDAVADPNLWGRGTAYEADLAKQYSAAADWLEQNAKRLQVDSGSLYKVDIPDEAVAKFLDWDKPLSQQAPEVRAAIRKEMPDYGLGTDKRKSADAYFELASRAIKQGHIGQNGEYVSLPAGFNEFDAASKRLQELGIPGIRYLDGGSRTKTGGELVDVLQKDGQWYSKIRKTPSSQVGDVIPMAPAITTSMPFKTENEARQWAQQQINGGTSNYVLFDDQLPRILERNGQPTGLQPWAKGEWKGLLDEPAPKLTEFEQRHLTAQKNAALPVEQGGLGLPPNNTAMDRARAMGFDTPAYHGTGDDRIVRSSQFKDSMLGKNTRVEDAKKGHFTASTGEAASEYTWNNGDMTGNVLPLLLRGERDTKRIPGEWMPGSYDSFIDAAKSSGKDGVTITGATTLGRPSDVHVTFDPANIRSRFAAFDPKRRHEADLLGYADPYLLGAMGAGGLLGIGGYSMMNDK